MAKRKDGKITTFAEETLFIQSFRNVVDVPPQKLSRNKVNENPYISLWNYKINWNYENYGKLKNRSDVDGFWPLF